MDQILEKIVIKPREILNLDIPEIAVGERANLTIFNTDEKWVYTPKRVRSKSRNSPYLNEELTGRALAIYNNGKLVVNTIDG
jgi:dihydroorotase